MRDRMRQLLASLAVLATGACAAGAPAPQFTDEDRAALRRTSDSALEIASRRPQDWNAYTALYYATDARVHMDGVATAEGRVAIAELLNQFSGIEDMRIEHVRVDGHGNLAYVEGRGSMLVPGADGQKLREEFRYLEVWQRQADGSWKVVEDISNRPAPAAPAP